MRIDFPPELPVSGRRDEIAAAIRDHQVVVVAGETGSGKTTQLPKICLELGRAADGRMIGHTQPRRIAARSVAERIGAELGTGLGDDSPVGYQVRFTDRTGPATRLKLMTDGILLAELPRDPMLLRYDTIVLDEAHERSLNVDFLLGYLHRLLPQRPDLTLVITSATIETQRFAEHFAAPDGTPAPVIEVSGRTYPVELRYRPLLASSADDEGDEDGEPVQRDTTEAVVDAVRELSREGPGDVLVFLPGEREIRDTADALAEQIGSRTSARLDVLPLYSRLSAAEQHRVFTPPTGNVVRRVVLATNVAETSLTVPGIRYVVDTGLARISRYSARTKVQRLPVEPISQASARQRSGRCGRVADGIAIRLYSEEDHDARPEFTDPEILRTNLASVVLRMAALGLGDVADFGFVEPPEARDVADGVGLLVELGALGPERPGGGGRRLTKLGRRLARLPVDPRIARMVLEAERLGCVREVIVIAAALSLQDPRERPVEQRPQADQAHARFRVDDSDFLGWLRLADHLATQQRELSSSAFRRMCRREFLNYLRVREWQDFASQLRQVCQEMGVRLGPPPSHGSEPDADAVHQALLSGLLSQVGLLEERERPERGQRGPARRRGPRTYLGARGARFAIFPGSALARRQPTFVMAGELVETGRLWGRQVAAIKPEWAERLGAHLVKRSYAEPHWSARRGSVVARERVTLYGVPLVADRLVGYGRIDPPLARELFIRHALVYGEWRSRHRFLIDNQRLLAEAEELEHRARRRGIVVDEHTLFDFYDSRVGEEVVSGAHFDTWWKQTRRSSPDLLRFDPAMLTHDGADPALIAERDFPDAWVGDGGLTFDLRYHFEPGAADDGVTVEVPVANLNTVEADDFSWHVPGVRHELVTGLLRSLPKRLRTSFVPAPQTAQAFLDAVPAGSEPLLDALERYLRATTGVHVPREAWDRERLPDHLRPTYAILGADGRVTARGKDLEALKAPLRDEFAAAVEVVAEERTATGRVDWEFGEVESAGVWTRGGHEVRAFGGLDDEGSSVGVGVWASADEAAARHRLGVRRLLALAVASPSRSLLDGLSNADKLALAGSPYVSVRALLDDLGLAVLLDAVDAADAERVRDRAAYDALLARAADGHEQRVAAALPDVLAVLEGWRACEKALGGRAELPMLPALSDMRGQLAGLVHDGFLGERGAAGLRRTRVHLAALAARHERLPGDVAGDRRLMDRVTPLAEALRHRVEALPEGRPPGASLRHAAHLVEEFRVSLWAQRLGTEMKVSEARILKALA